MRAGTALVVLCRRALDAVGHGGGGRGRELKVFISSIQSIANSHLYIFFSDILKSFWTPAEAFEQRTGLEIFAEFTNSQKALTPFKVTFISMLNRF